MSEEWRDIPGYEGTYQVSNRANVRSFDRLSPTGRIWKGKMLKQSVSPRGYAKVSLFKDGKSTLMLVHRLVAFAFLGLPDSERNMVNHKNGIKLDNTPENLEYVTNLENIQHAWRIGLFDNRKPAYGEQQGIAKLSNENALEIKHLLLNSNVGIPKIAIAYGVTRQTIHYINKGIYWDHIGEFKYPIRDTTRKFKQPASK